MDQSYLRARTYFLGTALPAVAMLLGALPGDREWPLAAAILVFLLAIFLTLRSYLEELTGRAGSVESQGLTKIRTRLDRFMGAWRVSMAVTAVAGAGLALCLTETSMAGGAAAAAPMVIFWMATTKVSPFALSRSTPAAPRPSRAPPKPAPVARRGVRRRGATVMAACTAAVLLTLVAAAPWKHGLERLPALSVWGWLALLAPVRSPAEPRAVFLGVMLVLWLGGLFEALTGTATGRVMDGFDALRAWQRDVILVAVVGMLCGLIVVAVVRILPIP